MHSLAVDLFPKTDIFSVLSFRLLLFLATEEIEAEDGTQRLLANR